MKLRIDFKPENEGIIHDLDEELKGLNAEFQKEGIFTKLYKHIPRCIRGHIPFDVLLENKSKLTILNSHDIAAADGYYIFFIDLNQDTLDAFNVIRQAINAMPLRLRMELERRLLRDENTRLEDITEHGIKKKIKRGMEKYGMVLKIEEVKNG